MIDYKDISFVVQGQIVGKPTDPLEVRHTYQCLKSIRKSFPGATIILSTWENSDTTDLEYDVLVRSVDPGLVVHADTSNGYRQIISSLNGLKAVKTKYAVKTRNDLVFKNDHILKYFLTYNQVPFDPTYKILNERVVVLTSANPHRRMKVPFWQSDWFFFGRTEDVLNIFDIPMVSENIIGADTHGVVRKLDSVFSTEQYIWLKFLGKHRTIPMTHMNDISGDNIALSERYWANNCIMLSARRAGIAWLKFPGAQYAQIPALSNNGLYTFTEYKQLLNTYAGARLRVIPNPIEELTYAIIYRLRYYIEKKSPVAWNIIRRIVNPRTHRKLDAYAKSKGQFW